VTENFEAFVSRLRDFQTRTWSAAQPVETDALAARFELLELERMLEGDVKCEKKHDHWVPECTVEVTHRLFAHKPHGIPVCTATAGYVEAARSGAYGDRCGDCGETIKSHWRVVPI
jgi:hypothetical protein